MIKIEKLNIIINHPMDPFLNMAIDEVLLKRKTPILRLYSWLKPTLSLGRFQKLEKINTHFLKNNNIAIVRRITGGKAVLHDKELTYSFIADKSLFPESIIDSYKILSIPLINTLKEFKLNPTQNKNEPNKTNSQNCFYQPSYYEILVNNKKIIGSAQARKKDKILQHGSILIDIDYNKLSSCFKNSNVSKLQQRITSLSKETPIKITQSILTNHLIQSFTSYFGAKIINSSLTKSELLKAEKLVNNKYKNSFI